MYKPKQNARGLGRNKLLVIGAAAVIVLVFGYQLIHHDNKTTTTKSNSTPSKTVKASPTVSYNTAYNACLTQVQDTNVCHFTAAEAASPVTKTAYKATMTSTNSGITSSMVFEQDGKGNNSLSDTSSSGSFNSVTYAGVMYFESDGAWVAYPNNTAASQGINPSTDLSFMGSLSNTTFTKLGQVACGNLSCLKYQFTDKSSPGTTNYVWFDTQNYLLREFNTTDQSGNAVDMKLSYQPVSISQPSPVVDSSSAIQ